VSDAADGAGGGSAGGGRAVDLLAELVRIRSVNPVGHGDADGEARVAERLRAPLDAAGLETDVLVSPGGRPSLLARLPGPTDVAPLVLVSHLDVVPTEDEAWSRDPFGGEVVGGELWGRGTLDMKGIAVMHVAAAAALATAGGSPTREVVLVAVADEEAGGAEGAEWLVRDHPERVGFRASAPPPDALGEGGFGLSGLLPRPVMPIVVGEKAPLGVRARATGAPGHGSMPPTDQAIRELARFIERVSGPRPARIHPVMREQFATFASLTGGAQGRVFQLLAGRAGAAAIRALAPLVRARSAVVGNLIADTVTPTQVRGGYAHNVVPGEAEVRFDCRLLPDTDAGEVLRELAAAGRGLGIDVEELDRWVSPISPSGDLFSTVADVSAGLPDAPVPVASLTPGLTDLRFWRARGGRAYGWAPVVLTPEQVATFHGHDERIPVDGFLRAVTAMTEVVRRAAGCTPRGTDH
jgi:acetylornithine deacetylase/succinyl-diaminopimelate desuccinylase-like protein